MDSDFRGGVNRARAAYRQPSLVVARRSSTPQGSALFLSTPPKTMDIIRVTTVREEIVVAPNANVQFSAVHMSKQTTETVSVGSVNSQVVHSAPTAVTAKASAPSEVPTGAKSTINTSKKQRLIRLLPAALAVIVLIAGGLLTAQAVHVNKTVEQQVRQLSSAAPGESSLPTNEKPKDPNYIQNYKVGPQLPQTIVINKIKVHARVMQVGTDKEGRMDVPKTAYDVGWYTGSSRPNEPGAMVIDGHVQGVGGGAIFTHLDTLVTGDTVSIIRGDGKQFDYKVVATEKVPLNEVNMAKLLVSADTTKPGMNLITCAGNFSQSSQTYSDRTIVYTVQQ
ncbi:MAG: class F sortase [Candidatus Saccharimonas sp.]